jgi:hypothetical protein
MLGHDLASRLFGKQRHRQFADSMLPCRADGRTSPISDIGQEQAFRETSASRRATAVGHVGGARAAALTARVPLMPDLAGDRWRA